MNNSKLSIFTVFFLVPMCIPLIIAIAIFFEVPTIAFSIYVIIFAALFIIIPVALAATISILLRNWILKHQLTYPKARWMIYSSFTGSVISFIYGMVLDRTGNIRFSLSLAILGLTCALIACSILIYKDQRK